MTLTDLQRAALVLFAAREVGPKGSLDQMKAVCYVMRNRMASGWGDGSMLALIAGHASIAAHNWPFNGETYPALDLNDRRLQMLARDIDEIYFGQADEELAKTCGRIDKERGPILYWSFIDRPITVWFHNTIIRQPNEHKQRAQVGNSMYLYE